MNVLLKLAVRAAGTLLPVCEKKQARTPHERQVRVHYLEQNTEQTGKAQQQT